MAIHQYLPVPQSVSKGKDMIRLIVSIFAMVLLIIGVVALISPIPIGVIIIAISLSILVCVSDTAKRVLKKVRTRYHKINLRLHKLEARLEKRFSYIVNAFIQTRPTDNKENDQ